MSTLLENTQQFIGDEPVQYAFTAQTGLHPSLRWLTRWLIVLNKARIVAVTPTRIMVLEAGQFRWKRRTPLGVVAELPRTTPLGPLTGGWTAIALGHEKLWFPRSLYPLLEQANTDIGPPPPAPR